MDIVLYTIDCPKCKVLESKLKAKNISYNICKDENYMKENNLTILPCLEVNGNILNFKEAVEWVNGQGGQNGNYT